MDVMSDKLVVCKVTGVIG